MATNETEMEAGRGYAKKKSKVGTGKQEDAQDLEHGSSTNVIVVLKINKGQISDFKQLTMALYVYFYEELAYMHHL